MTEAVEGHPVGGGWARVWRRLRRQRAAAQQGEEARLPRPGMEVGGFRLEAKLGEGSYGTVYRARRGGRLYAVKFLYLPEAGDWAWRELEVLLRVRRTGLVAVEGYGQWPDRAPRFLFLALPYVRGRPLFDWALATNATARRVAELVLALARQLAKVHRVGVVHRDVKGANVLVREEDGQPVLVDFGVGTYAEAPEVTSPLMPPGTALYRSPEVIRFRREKAGEERYRSTPGDDLWALGVVLYWLLTGAYPFEGKDPGSLAEAILRAPAVPPHERNPRVPRPLSEVCLRMLEKAPEARYPDADAVAAALEAALAAADASWDVPLCEVCGPDSATTSVELEPAPLVEASTLLSTTLAASPSEEEANEEAPPASEPPRARVPWREVGWVVLALVVLAVVVAVRSRPAPPPVVTSPVAPASPTPQVTATGQEVALPWCPLDGGAGAAPAWASTPAPVASATHLEDTRVKTPRKDSTQPGSKQKTKDTGSTTMKVGTLALYSLLTGCSGTPVRPTPGPAECPAGSQEAMARWGIEPEDMAHTEFPDSRLVDFVTVRAGDTQVVLTRPLGRLPGGTVFSGKFFLGKEYVFGCFTKARTPEGETFPICGEAWDIKAGGGGLVRGLIREPDGGGPDTAKVTAVPLVKMVERFE